MCLSYAGRYTDPQYLYAEETELFLETLDFTEVWIHAKILGANTLEQAMAIAKRLAGIPQRSFRQSASCIPKDPCYESGRKGS